VTGKLQIGSIVLAAYLLALPILFVFHSFTHNHSHENNCTLPSGFENNFIEDDDCGLCDLFQNQNFLNQKIPQLFKAELVLEEWIFTETVSCYASSTYTPTRGPPASLLLA